MKRIVLCERISEKMVEKLVRAGFDAIYGELKEQILQKLKDRHHVQAEVALVILLEEEREGDASLEEVLMACAQMSHVPMVVILASPTFNLRRISGGQMSDNAFRAVLIPNMDDIQLLTIIRLLLRETPWPRP